MDQEVDLQSNKGLRKEAKREDHAWTYMRYVAKCEGWWLSGHCAEVQGPEFKAC